MNWGLVAVGGAALGGAYLLYKGMGTFAQGAQITGFEMPSFEMPDISLPDITFPDISGIFEGIDFSAYTSGLSGFAANVTEGVSGFTANVTEGLSDLATTATDLAADVAALPGKAAKWIEDKIPGGEDIAEAVWDFITYPVRKLFAIGSSVGASWANVPEKLQSYVTYYARQVENLTRFLKIPGITRPEFMEMAASLRAAAEEQAPKLPVSGYRWEEAVPSPVDITLWAQRLWERVKLGMVRSLETMGHVQEWEYV